jgi:hypothetical protein
MTIQPPSSERYGKAPEAKLSEEKALLKEEQEEQLLLFFINYQKESAPAGDTSTKEGRIREVEKEVKEGKITVVQAAEEILAILQEHDTLKLAKMQPTKHNDPEMRLLTQLSLFAHYLHHRNLNAQLERALSLANQIGTGKVKAKEGIASFNKLIQAANKETPTEPPYPTLD